MFEYLGSISWLNILLKMNKTYLCIDYVLNKSRNPTLMNDGPWCMAEYDIAGEMVLEPFFCLGNGVPYCKGVMDL